MTRSLALIPSPEPADDPLLAFAPVPRKNALTKGWTPAKQRGFVAALRETGSVRLSAEAMGMSVWGVYKLRHAPGGGDFARAWDEAVAIGAQRTRDVLIDQAVHGVPERVLIGKNTVIERRRFNHRTMIWVLQHHMADHYPGGSTTQRRGWGGAEDFVEPDIEEVRASILTQLDAIERHGLREIAADPAKRAAWELLNGPRDWAALER